MPQRTILLNPGPVNVSARVQAALSRGDFCHREPEVLSALADVRKRLCRLFCPHPEWTSCLVTGSGTAALEMAVAATVGGDDRILVINNGTYGERIKAIALAHGRKVAELHGPPTERPDLTALGAMIERDRSIRWVAIVHHETTTGLLNDVPAVAALAKRHGRRVLVDAISSLAGDPLPIVDLGLDLVVGTANKCVQGVPGVSFVLGRRDAISEAASRPPTSVYLHLPLLLQTQDKGSHPFTMAVQVLFALQEALAELEEETVAGRTARLRGRAGMLREGFAKLGLAPLLPAHLQSNTLTSLRLPRGTSYDQLHDALKQRGFVIYAGQGKLASEIFRVANMGAVTREEHAELLTALAEVLPR